MGRFRVDNNEYAHIYDDGVKRTRAEPEPPVCDALTRQVMSGWEATAELRRREAAAEPPRAAAVIVGVTGATSNEEVRDFVSRCTNVCISVTTVGSGLFSYLTRRYPLSEGGFQQTAISCIHTAYSRWENGLRWWATHS